MEASSPENLPRRPVDRGAPRGRMGYNGRDSGGFQVMRSGNSFCGARHEHFRQHFLPKKLNITLTNSILGHVSIK